MKKLGIALICFSIVAFIICGVYVAQSYDKYQNYYNSDSYTSRNINAYVGGDAYNYIINGTYFTALAVYAVGNGLAGILMLVCGAILIAMAEQKEYGEMNRSELFEIKKLLEASKNQESE